MQHRQAASTAARSLFRSVHFHLLPIRKLTFISLLLCPFIGAFTRLHRLITPLHFYRVSLTSSNSSSFIILMALGVIFNAFRCGFSLESKNFLSASSHSQSIVPLSSVLPTP